MTSKEPYMYKAFGLNISSELECLELLPTMGTPQVSIRFGEVPDQLEYPETRGVRFQVVPGLFLLQVDRVARYLVRNGSEIIIAPDPGAKPNDIRLFLLGSVAGALIHQRGLLPIHGSAVAMGNLGVIFSGISGSGKSTLAASLQQKGYPFLCDDICVIDQKGENHPKVNPGFPQMKLWADSLKKLGIADTGLPQIREGLEKHAYKLNQSFPDSPLPLAALFLYSTKNTPGIDLQEIKGLEKFNLLKNNVYRPQYLSGEKNKIQHFHNLSRLASQVHIFKLCRPAKGFDLEGIIGKILACLQEKGIDTSPAIHEITSTDG